MHPALDTAFAAILPSLFALGGYRFFAAGDPLGLFAAVGASAALVLLGARRRREL